LRRTEKEVWLMRFGWLMDLVDCHRIYIGAAKPAKEKRIQFIDEAFPMGML
jgi:hypothetical protein